MENNLRMNLLIGSIGILLSFLVVVYREKLIFIMGKIDWAESKLGPGGSYLALILFGVIGFFVSLMILTGTFGLILGGFVGTFFGSFSP